MKVKQSLIFIISGLFLFLGLLLVTAYRLFTALIRIIVSMAHRIRYFLHLTHNHMKQLKFLIP